MSIDPLAAALIARQQMPPERGAQGPAGLDGLPGKDGPIGPIGPIGPPGEDGQDGKDGPTGPEGKRGPKGEKGDKGDQGKKGDIGPAGRDGGTKGGGYNVRGFASGMVVDDEGTHLNAGAVVGEINFTGAGVTAAMSGGKAVVDIPGTGGGGAVDSVNGQVGVVSLDLASVVAVGATGAVAAGDVDLAAAGTDAGKLTLLGGGDGVGLGELYGGDSPGGNLGGALTVAGGSDDGQTGGVVQGQGGNGVAGSSGGGFQFVAGNGNGGTSFGAVLNLHGGAASGGATGDALLNVGTFGVTATALSLSIAADTGAVEMVLTAVGDGTAIWSDLPPFPIAAFVEPTTATPEQIVNALILVGLMAAS